MSLEAAVQENTAALAKLSALIADLMARPPTPDAPAQAPGQEKDSPKPNAEKTAAPTTTAADTAPTAEAAEADAPKPRDAPSLTYDGDVAPAILALSKSRGRAQAVELLKTFGAAKGTDLKPAQFVDFVAKAKELAS